MSRTRLGSVAVLAFVMLTSTFAAGCYYYDHDDRSGYHRYRDSRYGYRYDRDREWHRDWRYDRDRDWRYDRYYDRRYGQANPLRDHYND
jgi:Rps23 Pro-64 3,4-dihydroxylase Tpa1-like proline 4-hydroxylase